MAAEEAGRARPPDDDGLNRSWILTALDEHEGKLTRYALRLTGDEHAARDVVQHVFLQLCDHPPQSRNGQLTSWLFTVCHNRAMDFRRRAGRDASLELVSHENLAAADALDPAKAAEADDAVELLRGVIETLPDAQRLVVNLWSAGFRYAEIAELIGKSESYVRVASHRAWQAIRKHPSVRKLLAETIGETQKR